jgi:hypothetical protein
VSIEWDVTSFTTGLRAMAARVNVAIPPATLKAMELVRASAYAQTPWDTRQLMNSETVRPSVGGAEVYIPGPYARYQHYGLDFKHPRGGNALYLQLPVITEGPAVIKMVGDDIGKAI